MKKIQDYLYEVEFDNYDYNYGLDALNYTFNTPIGACSAVRCGNFFGRNFDWYYDNTCEFIIHVPGNNNRHASIGVTYSLFKDTDINDTIDMNKYNVIPFLTMDGINDSGLVISINVVSTGDNGYTTGTNPGLEDLITIMIPRFLLDNAGSVDEAINLLNNRNIYTPLSQKMKQEFHFMIADKDKSVVIEFINNKMVVLEDEKIMTNFYLSDKDPIHPMGIERYNILKENYNMGSSNSGMINLMKKVYYTNTYDFNKNPFWYSEYCGMYKGTNLTYKNVGESYIGSDFNKAGAYKEILESVKEKYALHKRDKSLWFTEHMSVYDIENKKLTIIVQENNIKYEFPL